MQNCITCQTAKVSCIQRKDVDIAQYYSPNKIQ